MAAKKYLSLALTSFGVRLKEIVATIVSAGAANEGDLVALDPTGRLDPSVLPVGIGADTGVVPAFENLAAGNLVNYFDDAGTVKARKADSSTEGKEADGYVLAAVTTGNNALVYHEGSNTQLSGLTPGARYYTATTPGGVTTTPPTATGSVVQYVGRAISATVLVFEADEGIIRA